MPVENELSERELEIIRKVATGASNKEIAQQLAISPNTVKVHLKNIFVKIEVVSRTEATLYAIRHQIVPVPSQLPVPRAGEYEDLTLTYNTREDAVAPAAGGMVPQVTTQPEAAGAHEVSVSAARARYRPRAWMLVLGAAFLVMLAVAGGMGLSGWLHPAPLEPTLATIPATQDVRPTLTAVATTSSAAAFAKAQDAALATLQAQSASGAPVRWSQLAPMPEGRSNLAAAVYENRIYTIGGDTALGVTGAVLSYDPEKNSWQALTAKPLPVADVQAVLLGEKLYVPGGRLADGQPTHVLEVYDPRRDAWERKADLPQAVSGYSLAALEGRMVLFGGWDGQRVLASVFEYDPAADRWTQKTDMPTARAFSGAAASGGKIFVMGGTDGKQALTTNQVYFQSRDGNGETPWETASPLPEARQGMAVAGLVDTIYLAGGKDQAKSFDQAYSPQSDRWMVFESSPVQVGAGAAMVPFQNQLYLIGGETKGGPANTNQVYQAIYTVVIPIIQK